MGQPGPCARGHLIGRRGVQRLRVPSSSDYPKCHHCGRPSAKRDTKPSKRRRNFCSVFCHVCQRDKFVTSLAIKILSIFASTRDLKSNSVVTFILQRQPLLQ